MQKNTFGNVRMGRVWVDPEAPRHRAAGGSAETPMHFQLVLRSDFRVEPTTSRNILDERILRVVVCLQ